MVLYVESDNQRAVLGMDPGASLVAALMLADDVVEIIIAFV